MNNAAYGLIMQELGDLTALLAFVQSAFDVRDLCFLARRASSAIFRRWRREVNRLLDRLPVPRLRPRRRETRAAAAAMGPQTLDYQRLDRRRGDRAG